MSQPSRPRARGSEPRRRRKFQIEAVQALEDRQLLTPYLTTTFNTVALANVTTSMPVNGLVTTTANITVAATSGVQNSAAPFTSVSQLAPSSAFGGDIVRIEAGPGGDFGKGVYAISRGSNVASTSPPTLGGHPGLIYRVDPATGQSSLFFDLNTVISQVVPGGNAANPNETRSGLVNWYDLAFDPEGYFDGRPSLFVSSISSLASGADPTNTKNAIYRIGPDGSFLGLFIRFSAGSGTQAFTRSPSAILVPPPEQQTFLRGLLVGEGNQAAGNFIGGFTSVFFDASSFRPGQDLNTAGLPQGAFPTSLTFGPQTGFAPANADYGSSIYATFTDFGTPAEPVGGNPAFPGFSGVQGLGGGLLIGPNFRFFSTPLTAAEATIVNAPATAATPSGVDMVGAITTPFRRFQDIAFDHYGYFSQGATLTAGAAGAAPTVAPIPPNFAGSLFVADLATGLAVALPPPASGASNNPGSIPVQGPGFIRTVVDTTPDPDVIVSLETSQSNLGGRIIRIQPDGTVRPFAQGFNTSGRQDSGSFIESSLSISFSADGTTLYAADNDGIWQFKTVTSLAGSTTGSLIGLNDLRSLGVPYQGQDSAVAIIDTGIDAGTPNFRGRVAAGFNTLNRGAGNDDPAAGGGAGTGGGTGVGNANGHGTLLAGVV
ncbi:MAG TPA: hypothetical protein VF590_02355, partial [Isosphaeraceae bacterium]